MDGYIEFLQETLLTEVSMNNLALQPLNEEGGILTKIKDAIKWIVKQIGNILSFITSTVMKVLKAAISVFSTKKLSKRHKEKMDNKSTEEVPKHDPEEFKKNLAVQQPKMEFTVPKAVGFANDITNNLNKDKILSWCHSKNNRTEEITKRKEMIVERCQNARKLGMTKKVGMEEFDRLSAKSAADIERATVHIKSIESVLKSLKRELESDLSKPDAMQSKQSDLELTKLNNTKQALTMVGVVLGEFTKTVAWQTKIFRQAGN